MNIIDSSLWLEYFADTETRSAIIETIENHENLIVPTITLYEVFKKVLIERNEEDALFVIAHMRQSNVIVLDDELSLNAAKISRDYKLPMADSIIYATNLKYNAILWTQDNHFKDLPFVHYFEKIV
jgi:predicted nucleic acid-binding protein